MTARLVRTVAIAAILVSMLLATISISSSALAVSRPSGPLLPESGTLLGVWVDDGNKTWTRTAVTDFETLIGRKLDIDHRFYAWTNTWPGSNEEWDRENGRIPLVTWEPWGTTLADIAGGKHDALITERAQAAKAYGGPIFLRWAHEMNGNWYPWDGSHNGNDPSRYVAAWRRIHGIFAAQGATNVVWVWCPNAESVPNQSWNHWTNYYPGDAYVDWVGIDGYNFGTTETWSSWRSFQQIFQPVYDTYASRKPIMIGETGSAEDGGSKATWITEMREAIKTTMPSIGALVYFNARSRWPVTTSESALEAFKALAADAHFNTKTASPEPSPSSSPEPSPSPEPSTSPEPSPSPEPEIDSTAPAITKLTVQPQPVKRKADVTFTLSERATVTVTIRNAAGTIVRTLRSNVALDAGSVRIRWDRRDDRRRFVPAGTYTVVVVATDAAANVGSASTSVRVA